MKTTKRERVKAGFKSVKRAVGRRKAKPLWAGADGQGPRDGVFCLSMFQAGRRTAKAKPLWAEPTAKASVRLVKFG